MQATFDGPDSGRKAGLLASMHAGAGGLIAHRPYPTPNPEPDPAPEPIPDPGPEPAPLGDPDTDPAPIREPRLEGDAAHTFNPTLPRPSLLH